jgi:zinc transport system substrate-binding protein
MRKLLLLILFLTLVFLSCGDGSSDRGKIGVVVTILPQKEFVESIAEDNVEVSVLVPPGASPHTYEPTPGQLKKVVDAKIYFIVGSGIEFERIWMDKILDLNEEIIIIDGAKDIELIEMGENVDPHIWLSPKNAMKMVESFYEGIVGVDKENKEFYLKNKDDYIRRLKELDEMIVDELGKFEGDKFIAYHSSWEYFARDYNLEQVSIESGDKEITSEDIKRVVSVAKENDIRIIFTSPQFSDKNAKVISEEIGGEVISIDPLAEDYLKNMRIIVDKLQQGISGNE